MKPVELQGEDMTDGPKEYSLRANHAIGMVAEQISGTILEATARLEERAAASGRTLDQIAEAVIDRSIRFDPTPPT